MQGLFDGTKEVDNIFDFFFLLFKAFFFLRLKNMHEMKVG